MGITREDIEIIERHLDERYVLQSDCNSNRGDVQARISKQSTKIEIATHDLAGIKKGIWIVATASIGSLVTALANLILGG